MDGKSVRLSIVVTVRDRLDLFRRFVQSLEGQLEAVTDLIVVVDPSQEAPMRDAQNCLPRSEKIKVVKGKASGAGPGRNLGLTLAAGTHVWFVDSDDILLEDSISAIKQEVARLGADVTVFGAVYRAFDSEHSFVPHWLVKRELLNGLECFDPDSLGHSIFQFTTPAPWNKIFAKDFLIQKDLSFSDLASFNDVEFIMLSLAEANVIGVSSELIYEYTLGSPGSLQASSDNRSLPIAIRSLRRELASRGRLMLFERSFVLFSRDIILWWIKKRNVSLFRKVLLWLSFFDLVWFFFAAPSVRSSLRNREASV